MDFSLLENTVVFGALKKIVELPRNRQNCTESQRDIKMKLYVLLHDDLGSALGEEPESTTLSGDNGGHALSYAIKRIHPRKGFLRKIVPYGLIFLAQG